jgi:hypothetical protein
MISLSVRGILLSSPALGSMWLAVVLGRAGDLLRSAIRVRRADAPARKRHHLPFDPAAPGNPVTYELPYLRVASNVWRLTN